MPGKSNRYLQAFKESHNVIGLATAFSVFAATWNPLTLCIGLVAEAAYLIFVPDSKWYEARLSRRDDAEIAKRREELKAKILPLLRSDMKERFNRMEAMLRGIETQSTDDTKWYREVVRKLDFLLEKFLHFASKEVQFRNYLVAVLNEVRSAGPSQTRASVRNQDTADRWNAWEKDDAHMRNAPAQTSRQKAMARANGNGAGTPSGNPRQPANGGPPRVAPPVVTSAGGSVERGIQQVVGEIQQHYDAELTELRASAETEQDTSTKAVLLKRLDVLQRRREFIGKIGKVLINLNHQLLLMEDTFGLISDEIRARPPEQVLSDIDDVVFQTKTMTELLEEVAPYENTISGLAV